MCSSSSAWVAHPVWRAGARWRGAAVVAPRGARPFAIVTRLGVGHSSFLLVRPSVSLQQRGANMARVPGGASVPRVTARNKRETYSVSILPAQPDKSGYGAKNAESLPKTERTPPCAIHACPCSPASPWPQPLFRIGWVQEARPEAAASDTDKQTSSCWAKLIDAKPGDVVEIPAGTLSFGHQPEPEHRRRNGSHGAGKDATILDFTGQVNGAEGHAGARQRFHHRRPDHSKHQGRCAENQRGQEYHYPRRARPLDRRAIRP